METSQERRQNCRSRFRTEIQYIDEHTRQAFEARVCNVSREGIYFETRAHIAPGAEGYVKIPRTPESERAHIVWRQERLRDAGEPVYAIGAAFDQAPVNM